jgi:anthranilate phosphoribosyltransferase
MLTKKRAMTTTQSGTTTTRATQANMRTCIRKVATGPEHSKDLSFEEACAGMALILNDEADPVQAAVLLISLRMKRETEAENTGILQAILDSRQQVTSQADEIFDIADPYNGQIRGLPVAPFIAPVLSACGVPAYSHGVESVGPKFGITHKMVLAAAGIDVERGTQQVADQLADDNIGWGYLDQSHYCPGLYNLISLRKKMVKRTVITTLEVLTRPISGRKRTHLLTGYVHKAYPPVYAKLARFSGYDSAAIVRGVEGGVIPSLLHEARYYRYTEDQNDDFVTLEPTQLGIKAAKRMVPLQDGLKTLEGLDDSHLTMAIKNTVNLGVSALQNEPGPARDSLMYSASIALHHLNRFDTLLEASQFVSRTIASGDCYDKFKAHH